MTEGVPQVPAPRAEGGAEHVFRLRLVTAAPGGFLRLSLRRNGRLCLPLRAGDSRGQRRRDHRRRFRCGPRRGSPRRGELGRQLVKPPPLRRPRGTPVQVPAHPVSSGGSGDLSRSADNGASSSTCQAEGSAAADRALPSGHGAGPSPAGGRSGDGSAVPGSTQPGTTPRHAGRGGPASVAVWRPRASSSGTPPRLAAEGTPARESSGETGIMTRSARGRARRRGWR